jgi:DNA mismatch repair protein MutS2
MAFFVTQKALERLEWPRVLDQLRNHARTPGGRLRCDWDPADDAAGLFEATEHGVRERLAETAEARSILASGQMPPLGDAASPEGALQRARKGGSLNARELLDVCAVLSATRATRSFIENRDHVPRLLDLASLLVEHRSLESDIDFAIDRSGEVRDSASPALARARSDARRLAAEIQTRVGRYLGDPNTVSHLSDSYYTIRNDRYVLPVRTDARGSVRGIVHDASNSGQTLFVEPEALVELNNQHKRAEIDIEQETRRVLRGLSRQVAAIADEVDANTATLEIIDLAFARGGFCEEVDAVEPEVGMEGVIHLNQLRHPLLPMNEVVGNDVRLGDDFQTLILSGPNAGGKTVTLKAIALAGLFIRSGLHVPAAPEAARVDLFDAVLADIGDEQDIREHLSTFSAHMANLAEITRHSSPGALVVLDEVGVGTDPSEGAALAQAALERLADTGARVVVTTHYNLLKEMAEVDERFANACVDFDPDTLEPTYRLRMGLPGASSATAVAARMGMPAEVIDRANEILQREDRQLDRMLSELASSRAALEAEQREIAQIRDETESARDEHRARLERLQQRRDKLFLEMRGDLERSFREAHEQVARVIADLQKKGTAQQAARTRERLIEIADRSRDTQREAGLEPEASEGLEAIDWTRARAGDSVQVQDGSRAVLLALPDKRGRVAVRIGSARVLLPMQRVGVAQREAKSQRPRTAVRVERAPVSEGLRVGELDAGRCNLHGMRVEEAIDRLVEALDRALASDRMSLAINHGVGTGALRRAVRDFLRQSPYIARYASARKSEGGEGVTIAEFV